MAKLSSQFRGFAHGGYQMMNAGHPTVHVVTAPVALVAGRPLN